MARHLLGAVCATLLSGFHLEVDAQRIDAATAVASWPTSWSPEPAPPPAPAGLAEQERQRLPIYDDAGEPIPFELVQARVDPSGAGGAILGGLVMSAAGALVGALLTAYDCNESRGGYYFGCSPRENATRSALTGGLAATFGVAGLWWGWESDKTTWDEALQQIRDERAGGRR